jgi:hypothetical protein
VLAKDFNPHTRSGEFILMMADGGCNLIAEMGSVSQTDFDKILPGGNDATVIIQNGNLNEILIRPCMTS